MGRIQTNIGLITGIPIGETVEKLMQLAAQPRDLTIQRNEVVKQEQVALTELSALLVSVQYMATNLGKDNLYDQRTALSSNESVLSAAITGDPLKGNYRFTPIRLVEHHQLLSSGFTTDTEPLGGGTLSFRFGAHVERSIDLDAFGGGQGVVQGAIRITDRSGASAQIDLSTVRTVDDVLEAVNGNTTINVTAVAEGDRIRLIDHTGQTVSNLKVQEIGRGTTAASLGLAGIDVAQDTADGQDMLWLTDDLNLDLLNDGNGVFADRSLDDLQYELRDGTTGTIDLSPIIPGGSEVDEETTLGEILDVINAANPNLTAEIADDGDRLILTDLTAGDGNFTVQSLGESTALENLGLDGDSVDGLITGRRILGGVKTVLLSSLDGGRGFGGLGSLALTDRSGATDTVDLSGAETLDDAIDVINAAGVGIVAQVNRARNGIELADTTGASAGNLIVANADATNTADKLAIAVDADVTSVSSGDLHLQIITRNTRLARLNGGAGIARGKLTIYDTTGRNARLDLSGDDVQTVDDVIRAINRLGLEIRAEMNETGDGIRIRDLALGSGTLRVEEGNSTTAADLHLLGEAAEVEIEGQTTQVIDGSTTYTIELDDGDSLEALRDRINDLAAGVTATILFDGSGTPYRLSLGSDRPGSAGEMLVDTSALGLTFQETASARDALMVFGELSTTGPNVLISASSNTFTEVISGVRLEIKQTSTTPVTITVETTDTNLLAGVTGMVDNYNRFREKLLELTEFSVETGTGSVLTGDGTALRLDVDLSYLLSGRFQGAGSVDSLRQLGIDLKDDGTLQFDKAKLKAKYAQDPEAVKSFFADEQFGLSAKFGDLLDRLSGEENSLLAQRLKALTSKIDQNEERVSFLNGRLDTQRERLYLDFYRMELVIGKLQSNLSVLDSIKPLPSLIASSE